MKRIDILLATHNGEKYLQEQLDSIFNQSYKNWRLIIHDDNSSDTTVNIICAYKKKHPQRIIYIKDNKSFGNASANFSFLLEHADTNYIMFADQDDVWLNHKIEKTFQKMEEMEKKYGSNKPLMVFSDLSVVDTQLNTLAPSMWKEQRLDPEIIYDLYSILALNVVTGCTIMINKCAKEYVSPMPVSDTTHDHWIAVNISKYGYAGYIDEPLVLYRQHSNNTLGANSRGIRYFMKKVLYILKNIKGFQSKYSHFDFPLSLGKIILKKITLNSHRFIP